MSKASLFQRSKPYMCIIFGLGAFSTAKWQYSRKTTKENYFKLMHERLSSDPIYCPTSLTEEEINNEYKFKKVFVNKQKIDPKNNIILSPRKPPNSARIRNINVNDPNQLGGYLYTPITTNDGNVIILNQGWIPKDRLSSTNNNHHYNDKNDSFYQGLITPLKKIPKFVKDKTKFDVHSSNIWPFMDNELLHEKFGHDESDKNKSFIVVDVMEPQNEIEQYPHRIQESDLLMVNIPPFQHAIYVGLMGITGVASFYYAYYYFKNPTTKNILYKNRLNQLNKPRNKKKL